MGLRLGKTCAVGSLVLWVAAVAFAHNHHALNGTWVLVRSASNFAGEPIQNGTLTINDRQGNIYVSRNFSYEDGDHRIISYEFGADGPVNSTVREGKEMKTKAHWEGDALKVTTLEDGRTTVERFSLTPDGSLMLVVDREGLEPLMLLFRRVG